VNDTPGNVFYVHNGLTTAGSSVGITGATP